MQAMELDTMVTSDRFSKVQELIYELKVCDAMTREVVVVTPDRPMHELRAVLKDNRISGVPVVDGDALAGIISMEDFIKWMGNGSADCAIGTKMATGVHTVYEDDPLILAVSRLDQSHVGRLPVLNRADDKLVGVLTKGDVVAALLRQMEVDYHEEEIHRYRASHIFEDIIADEVIFHLATDCSGELRNLLRFARKTTSSGTKCPKRAPAHQEPVAIVAAHRGGKAFLLIQPLGHAGGILLPQHA